MRWLAQFKDQMAIVPHYKLYLALLAHLTVRES